MREILADCSRNYLTTTAHRVGGAQAAVRRPAREAIAHSAGRAQRALGVKAALGASVALALGACSHTQHSTPTLQPKKNTVILAACHRSAPLIRCWYRTTALCLCYLHWCRTTAQAFDVLVACVRFPRTRCALLVDCLDLGHESHAALSGQPVHSRRCSLAAQPRVCQAVRLQNTATSPNLALDPHPYMRQFELAHTIDVRSSYWDSTAEHYMDLPYAASL